MSKHLLSPSVPSPLSSPLPPPLLTFPLLSFPPLPSTSLPSSSLSSLLLPSPLIPSPFPFPFLPSPPSFLLRNVLFVPELPLVLFDCGYEGIIWQDSIQSSHQIITHFQELWTSLAVKATMVSRMLDVLTASHQQRSGPSDPAVPSAQLSALMSERIPHKTYKPLLTRPTAGEQWVTVCSGGRCMWKYSTN